jgi:hypothetical protein
VIAVGVTLGWILIPKDPPDDPAADDTPSRQEILADLREGGTLTGPPSAPFSLRHTDDWTPLPREQLEGREPEPLAGLRRRDNSGALTVTEGGPVEGGIARLRRTLPATLRERFDDFRLVAIRRVRVQAGPALYTSFVRQRTNEIQTVLVVPDGNRRSFQVDAVIRGAAADTAAEVGVMLGTFDIAGR